MIERIAHSRRIITGILIFVFILSVQVYAQAIKYKWEQRYYSNLNSVKSLLFSHEMRDSKLAFADIDFDGDQDIFLGQSNGEIAFFENRGTKAHSEFVLITQQYKAIFDIKKEGRTVRVRNTIDVGERSAPALVDIDNDGDYDLFVGSAEGNIWYFENQGNNLVPEFRLITTRFSNIDPGRNSVPIFADVNLKRKFDLLIGTVDGKVWLYMNEGTRKKPDFLKYPPQLVVQFGLETHASPSLFDWDADGDLDLVVGQKNGTLSMFLNQGDRFYPKWGQVEQNFQLIDIGGESAPYFVDMDNDGDSDLIIGSANPTAFYYENRIQNGKHVLWNRSTNLFRFHKLLVTGNRASIAAGDLDGDGDLDLIVGEKTGNLNYYENQGTNKEPDWTLITEELIFMTGVENSAPTLGDIDNDGDLDLLLGEKQGQIILVSNVGTPQKPEWELKDTTFFEIDVGSNSVPLLHDMDQDGDLDLLIGNYAGRIIYYLNEGTKSEPRFVIESTRFASAKVSKNAVPALFDWNEDGYPDLILGADEGKLQLLYAPGKVAEETPNWEVDEDALSTFNVYGLSHPTVHDFNGDSVKDLLIGNENGDFVLFINKGKEEIKQETETVVDNSIDQQSGSLVVEEVEGRIDMQIEPEEQQDDFFDFESVGSIVQEQRPERIQIDPIFVNSPISLIKNDRITKSVPTLGDIDRDGDLDLFIGSRSGKIYFYENVGTEREWRFELVSDDFFQTSNLTNSAPILFDIDQDGDLDAIIGTGIGRIYLYSNQGTGESPRFRKEESMFNDIWIGKNSKPSVADINGDGLFDLLVGSFKGRLTYIRNDSSKFNIIRRDYHHIDVNIGSTPFFADLSNADRLDLIIGSDSGMIHFYRNENKDFSGKWQLMPKLSEKLDFPRGSSPTLHDVDGDGDLDLITGSELGPILLYRNDALIPGNPIEAQVEILPFS